MILVVLLFIFENFNCFTLNFFSHVFIQNIRGLSYSISCHLKFLSIISSDFWVRWSYNFVFFLLFLWIFVLYWILDLLIELHTNYFHAPGFLNWILASTILMNILNWHLLLSLFELYMRKKATKNYTYMHIYIYCKWNVWCIFFLLLRLNTVCTSSQQFQMHNISRRPILNELSHKTRI